MECDVPLLHLGADLLEALGLDGADGDAVEEDLAATLPLGPFDPATDVAELLAGVWANDPPLLAAADDGEWDPVAELAAGGVGSLDCALPGWCDDDDGLDPTPLGVLFGLPRASIDEHPLCLPLPPATRCCP